MAKKALETGTYDGNTALVLAANMTAEGELVTVDLAPDFRVEKRASLTYSDIELNLAARDQLGRQYRGAPTVLLGSGRSMGTARLGLE